MLIQIQIVPHTDNRLLKVSAVSELFSWHGEQRLGGEESPRTVMFEVRHLPAARHGVETRHRAAARRSRGGLTSSSGAASSARGAASAPDER